MRNKRLWHWGIALGAACLLAVGVLLIGVNNSEIPQNMKDIAIAKAGEWLGAEVEVGHVRFVAPNVVKLYDVNTRLQEGPAAGTNLVADSIQVRFNLFRLLRSPRQLSSTLQEIQAVAPRVTVPRDVFVRDQAPSSPRPGGRPAGGRPPTKSEERDRGLSQPVRVRITDGSFQLGETGQTLRLDLAATIVGQRADIRTLQLHLGGSLKATGSMTWERGGIAALQWQATGFDLGALLASLGQEGVQLALVGEGTFGGPITEPVVEGTISAKAGSLPGDVPFDHLQMAFTVVDGLIRISDLKVQQGAGQVLASGTVDPRGGVNLRLEGRSLALQTLPFLKPFAVSGLASVNGRVSGQVTAPVLIGTVQMGKGTLWGRTVDSVVGEVQIDRERFVFDQAHITQGPSRYVVSGHTTFGGKDSQPWLDIALHSEAGRLEELLGVLNWDVEAQGQLDGDLYFSGPVGGVVTTGNAVLSAGAAWGQPFDQVAGSFEWRPDHLTLHRAEVKLGGGTLTAYGTVQPNGNALALQVHATQWPVERVTYLAERFGEAVAGRIGFKGTISGSLDEPALEGRLTGSQLRLSGVPFATADGEIHLSHGTWHVPWLSLARVGGGRYSVTGRVEGSDEQAQVNLHVQVQREPLADLLAFGKLAVPRGLVGGLVSGSVDVGGALNKPRAHLRMTWEDSRGTQDRLQLEMRVEAGKVYIDDVGFAA